MTPEWHYSCSTKKEMVPKLLNIQKMNGQLKAETQTAINMQ